MARAVLLQGSTALGCSAPGQEQWRGESIMPADAFAHYSIIKNVFQMLANIRKVLCRAPAHPGVVSSTQ